MHGGNTGRGVVDQTTVAAMTVRRQPITERQAIIYRWLGSSLRARKWYIIILREHSY